MCVIICRQKSLKNLIYFTLSVNRLTHKIFHKILSHFIQTQEILEDKMNTQLSWIRTKK